MRRRHCRYETRRLRLMRVVVVLITMAIHTLSTTLLVGANVSSSSSPSPSSTPDAAISSMTATETIVDSILTTINSSMRIYEQNYPEIDDGDSIEEKIESGSHQERHRRQRPFVTLTYAQSLDGKIALSFDNKQERAQIIDSQKTSDETMETDEGTMVSTQSQPQPPPTPSSSSNFAISGPESLLLTHGLRHVHDAVLIGGRTLLIDNPRLDNRLWTHHSNRVDEGGDGDGDDDDDCTTSEHLLQPRPVILDPDLKYLRRLGSSLRVAYPDKLIVCYHEDVQLLRDFIDSTTVTFLPCKGCHSGPGDNHDNHRHHLDIDDVLQKLREQCNIESVMVEGGTGVLSAFVAADVVDCYCITVAPILLGRNGLDAFKFAWNSRYDHNAHVDDSDDHRAVSIDLGQLQFIPLGNDCIVLSSR